MNIVQKLLEIGAIKVNINKPFIWTSGIKSPIYCDNRKSLGYYDLRHTIALRMSEIIREQFPAVQVIGGTATAGIPHATSTADLLKLPLVYFRSKPKEHGTASVIEGDCAKGAKIVIVEDLISTGGSVLKAADYAKEAGLEVLGVVAIFNYLLRKGIDNFEKSGIELHSIASFHDMERILNLDTSQAEFLKKWRQNPSDDSIWHR